MVLFLFGTGVFVVCLPSVAHAQFEVDIIKDLQPSQAHQEFWDTLWKVTFDRSNSVEGITNRLAFGAIGTMARWMVLIGLVAVLFQYIAGLSKGRNSPLDTATFSLRSLFPIIVILALLANQFAGVHAIALFANQWRQNIKFEAQKQGELGATFRDAIQDQYYADAFRREIGVRAAACEAMEHPLVLLPSEQEPLTPDPANPLTDEQRQLYKYLNCIQSLQRFIATTKADLDKKCANSSSQCKASKQIAQEKEDEYADLSDLQKFLVNQNPGSRLGWKLRGVVKDAIESSAQVTYRGVLDFIQWAYQGFLEFGFYLSAVAAPVVFAISLIPSKRHFMFDLMFGLLIFSIAEFFYIICLGIVSLMLQTPNLIEQGGRLFPLTYGLLAPIVSGSMLYGGFKSAAGFRGGVIGVASTAGGIAGGVGTSAVIAFGNRMHQRY
ncbi:MAG: hypothetical protein HC768_19215 [Acaryochloris sp. CRU_2_0]|nr:hypothetical protein [Acaryochloris sp. CRU_2_0]